MKVSVAIITYNHEKFIAEALDGALMQRTGFDYEIVVGEDCSTDGTRNILIDYRERYPHKVRLLLNERNVGGQKNGVQTLRACQGEYVAYLEGDDYWTSPNKLQKQVDFLDNHPECPMCFHNASTIYQDGSSGPVLYRAHQKEFSGVEDLLLDNFVPTCSVMSRKDVCGKFPDWVRSLKMGDWPSHILAALHGDIGYLDETMAVYRVHQGGVWSTKGWEEHEKAVIELYDALSAHLERRYARIINRILRHRFLVTSDKYEETGDLTAARACAVRSLKKHFLIRSELLKFGNKGDPTLFLPDYMRSFKTMELLKSLLRLCGGPMVKSHTPLLYKLLRSTAKKLNLKL
jgi:glycosyltransferase involved in cell wall biosynthesis